MYAPSIASLCLGNCYWVIDLHAFGIEKMISEKRKRDDIYGEELNTVTFVFLQVHRTAPTISILGVSIYKGVA